MSHEHGQTDEYGLVMPFVVVESKDGPYEDNAYAAGYEAGQFDLFLASLNVPPGGRFLYPVAVRGENLPQLDLIAMKNEFHASAQASEVEGWSFVTLTKGGG